MPLWLSLTQYCHRLNEFIMTSVLNLLNFAQIAPILPKFKIFFKKIAITDFKLLTIFANFSILYQS